jgi:hypothetical protein
VLVLVLEKAYWREIECFNIYYKCCNNANGTFMRGLPRRFGRQTDRVRRSDPPGERNLARIVAMLTRLVERFDANDFRVREDPSAI